MKSEIHFLSFICLNIKYDVKVDISMYEIINSPVHAFIYTSRKSLFNSVKGEFKKRSRINTLRNNAICKYK